jgi:hypothetical protein
MSKITVVALFFALLSITLISGASNTITPNALTSNVLPAHINQTLLSAENQSLLTGLLSNESTPALTVSNSIIPGPNLLVSALNYSQTQIILNNLTGSSSTQLFSSKTKTHSLNSASSDAFLNVTTVAENVPFGLISNVPVGHKGYYIGVENETGQVVVYNVTVTPITPTLSINFTFDGHKYSFKSNESGAVHILISNYTRSGNRDTFLKKATIIVPTVSSTALNPLTFKYGTSTNTSNVITLSSVTAKAFKLSLAQKKLLPGQSFSIQLDSNGNGNYTPVDPTVTFTLANADVDITSNTILGSDLVANSLTIEPGATLTTDGYNIYLAGTFNNLGNVITGAAGNGAPATIYTPGLSAVSYPYSFGGSGGGGATAGAGESGGSGGATLAQAGQGVVYYTDAPGEPGSTPFAPLVTNSFITYSYLTNSLTNSLIGAGGGAGSQCELWGYYTAAGGSGGYGLYLQAANIINTGMISSNGTVGSPTQPVLCPSGGSGGGGSIIFSGNNLDLDGGIVNVTGGLSVISTVDNADVYAGAGGNGLILTYQYLVPPILVVSVGNVPTSNAITITHPANTQQYANLSIGMLGSPSNEVQQMLQIPESSYSNLVYNGNTANFEITYINGTHIPGWIESNQSGVLYVWIKVKNTTSQVELDMMSSTLNLLSSSGTSGIGEAPQLSSAFGQYDDGSSVFIYYTNFVPFPSDWASWGTVTYVDNNGVTFTHPGAGGENGYGYTGASYSTPLIVETYGNITDWGGFGPVLSRDTAGFWTIPWAPRGEGEFGLVPDENGGIAPAVSTMQLLSLVLPTAGEIGMLNYNTILASTAGSFVGDQQVGLETTSYPAAADMFAQWFRVRTYTAGGAMSPVTYGQPESLYTQPSISQPTVALQNVEVGQTETLNAIISNGAPNFSGFGTIRNGATVTHTLAVAGQSSAILSEPWVVTQNDIGVEIGNFYIVDSQSNSANSISSESFNVYNALTLVSWTAQNSALELSMLQTLTAAISGGDAGTGYIYAYLLYNNAGLCASQVYVTVQTSNSYQPTLSDCGTGSITANILVTDSASQSAAVQNSLSYSVNNALSMSTWTASNALIPFGNAETLTATVSNGIPPYTYAYLFYNGAGVCSSQTVVNSLSHNTLVWAMTPTCGSGILTANILITDPDGGSVSNSLTFNVISAPAVTTSMSLQNTAETVSAHLTQSGTFASVVSSSSVQISTEVSTPGSVLTGSLYEYRMINGVPAFLNGTLFSSTAKTLIPLYTSDYYNLTTFNLPKGVFVFVFNSLGGNGYMPFTYQITVNQTIDMSKATSACTGSNCGSGGSNLVQTTAVPPSYNTNTITQNYACLYGYTCSGACLTSNETAPQCLIPCIGVFCSDPYINVTTNTTTSKGTIVFAESQLTPYENLTVSLPVTNLPSKAWIAAGLVDFYAGSLSTSLTGSLALWLCALITLAVLGGVAYYLGRENDRIPAVFFSAAAIVFIGWIILGIVGL